MDAFSFGVVQKRKKNEQSYRFMFQGIRNSFSHTNTIGMED